MGTAVWHPAPCIKLFQCSLSPCVQPLSTAVITLSSSLTVMPSPWQRKGYWETESVHFIIFLESSRAWGESYYCASLFGRAKNQLQWRIFGFTFVLRIIFLKPLFSHASQRHPESSFPLPADFHSLIKRANRKGEKIISLPAIVAASVPGQIMIDKPVVPGGPEGKGEG